MVKAENSCPRGHGFKLQLRGPELRSLTMSYHLFIKKEFLHSGHNK